MLTQSNTCSKTIDFDLILNIVVMNGMLSKKDAINIITNRYTKDKYSPIMFKYKTTFDGICIKCKSKDVYTSPFWNNIYCDSCGVLMSFRIPAERHNEGLHTPADIKNTIDRRHSRNSLRPLIKRGVINNLMTPDSLWNDIVESLNLLMLILYGTKIEEFILARLCGRFITCKQHIALINKLTTVLVSMEMVEIINGDIVIPDRWLTLCSGSVVGCDVDDHKKEVNTIQGCKLGEIHTYASIKNWSLELIELKLRLNENTILEAKQLEKEKKERAVTQLIYHMESRSSARIRARVRARNHSMSARIYGSQYSLDSSDSDSDDVDDKLEAIEQKEARRNGLRRLYRQPEPLER